MNTPNAESPRDAAIAGAFGAVLPLSKQIRTLLEEYLASILVCGEAVDEHVRFLTEQLSNHIRSDATISEEEVGRLLAKGLCEVADSTLIALVLSPDLLVEMTNLITYFSPQMWADQLIEAGQHLAERNGCTVPNYSEGMEQNMSQLLHDDHGITNQPKSQIGSSPGVNGSGQFPVAASSASALPIERPSSQRKRRLWASVFRIASSVLGLVGFPAISFLWLSLTAEQKRRDETHVCVPKDRLYTFSGLKTTRPGPLFQDFSPKSTADGRMQINTVSRLWADGFANSWITATVVNGKDAGRHANFLRIRFKNGAGGYSSNVTVRPKWEEAVIASEFAHLVFEARVPQEDKDDKKPGKSPRVSPEDEEDKPLDVVWLTVRVVDARDTHWEYRVRHPDQHINEEVTRGQSEGDGWKKVEIDLRDNSKWQLFAPEGNSTYAATAPDFSIISHVVIEVGGKGESRPGAGRGTVDIAHIRLE